MKLTATNTNISNALSTAKITLANSIIVNSISVGNVSITPSEIDAGNVVITPTSISVPTLVLGGTQFVGGQHAGIINYQEFTANGTWINPISIPVQQPSVSQGLTYTYYTQGSVTNPTTEAGLDALFNTATSSPTVTFGGTGIHSGTINWGDSGQTGAGGVVDSKPAYLPADQFSWMVEGYILAPETGTYFFGVDGDDAVDVFVNGVNVASYYGPHGFNGAWTGGVTGGTQVSGSISLTAGQYYTFRARMQEGGGGDGLQVGWRKPSDGAIALIPANAFFYGTVSNTAANLTGYEQVLVMAWGGGGGSNTSDGGGGGACVIGNYNCAQLANTCNVVVGNGGSGGPSATSGENSSFAGISGTLLTAYGGGRGLGSVGAGSGGGWLSAGSTTTGATGGAGGAPLGGAGANNTTQVGGVSTFGGGGGGWSTVNAGSSVYGGGGGVWSAVAGNSIFGGAGGSSQGAGGISVFGGRGGNSVFANGSIPGGGGSNNGRGGRGEVRVWVFGPAGTTAGAPTYSLTANTTTLYEGSSVLYTVSTTNIANGTTLYYTLNNSSTAVATDFTTAVNGSVIINGGTGTFTLTANNDADSANEAFQIDVRTGSTTGSIIASNGSVSIVPIAPVTVSYGSATAVNASGGPTSVNNLQIGTAASNRTVIVAVAINDSRANEVSSVSINGITASLKYIGRNSSAGGTPTSVGFWAANVASGTTANLSIGTGGTTDFLGVATFYAYGLESTNVTSSANSTSDPATGSVTIPAGGFAIAAAISGGASGATATWTNATEVFDNVNAPGVATTFSGAIINSTSGSTTSITCDFSTTTSGGRVFAAATWK